MTGLHALALLLSAVGIASAAEVTPHGDIAVVVGVRSPDREVTLDTLRELYLRRRRVWPDGAGVIPVNLPPDSDVREVFSKRVLGRLPRDLVSYWNRRYYEGIRPPLVLRSADAVCAYVAVEPAAIGYVPRDAVDGDTCRVLLTLPARVDD